MALAAVIAKKEEFEGLDSAFQAEYTQSGEGDATRWTLDVTAAEGFSLEDVTGLKSALQSERETNRKNGVALKAFEGLDPEETREKLSKYETLSSIDPKKEADRLAAAKIDAHKEAIGKSHKTELDRRDSREVFLLGQLESELIDNRIATALSDPDVKGRPALLKPVMRGAIRMRETEVDGKPKIVVEVVDAAGTARVNGQGKDMTIKDFALDLKGKAEFKGAFDGAGHSGGGGTPGGDRKPGSGKDEARGRSRIEKGLRDPRTVREASGAPPAGD